ncbi:hypothetical protein MWU49_14435 [Alcanivorax sp. S6407]|uniref:hypothetical protein n=1 Tax=Alcanivorax sp. S6407 TaxID=2926424 RepID=UPI001FF21364|nr:hypothetical protein [Alcanivorax sp. S6407]MCK0154910.1 hypothetical protein [Alcanivorax sp. S6407]
MSVYDDDLPLRVVKFSDIERYHEMERGAWWMHASMVHPVQRFYKYDWWIFWEGAPVDGDALIFREQYRLSTSEADALYVRLIKEKTVFFIYNRKRPRLDPHNPFDASSERWKGAMWAKPLAEDPDPAVKEGPWVGHK